LGDRLLPAVRRAARLLRHRTAGDRQVLHAEPVRLQPGLRRPAAQLRGRAVVPARHRRVHRQLHRDADLDPAGGASMSVPTTVAPDVGAPTRARTRRRALAQRKPGQRGGLVFPTIFMLAFLIYFLMPLFWLVVASTKSLDDLFSSFGLWFSNFNLIDN